MPRQRLSKDGPQIARPGHDVDTASPANMLFDPRLVAATVYATGTVTTADYSGGDGMGGYLRRAIVGHGRTFPMPPIVIPYEIVGSARRLHFAMSQIFPDAATTVAGCAGSVRVSATGFELYSGKPPLFTGSVFPAPGTAWRYVTLSNTLANS
ncbi:hypothetical protein [Aliihoeflea sp. PC F10.4]